MAEIGQVVLIWINIFGRLQSLYIIHKDMVHTLQRTNFGSIRKTKHLMVYRKIIAVFSEIHKKHKYSCVDKMLRVLKDWETNFCSMSRENLQLTRFPQRYTSTQSLQIYSAFCHRCLWFLNLFFDLASDNRAL